MVILAIAKLEVATARTDKSFITRLIERYTDSQELWAEKAHRHTAKVEQAGRDRSLFQDSQKSGVIPIKSIEYVKSIQESTALLRYMHADTSILVVHTII